MSCIFATGILLWIAALSALALGFWKSSRMVRGKFRYEYDMYKTKQEMWNKTRSVFSYMVSAGTVLVLVGKFI